MSRASSRGSQFSDGSRRSKQNAKSTRSRIGDSPLTAKEFDIPSNPMHSRDYGNTVADSYKNGPAPSERMKKFNSSQAPLINPSNSMINEYNNLASTDMSQRINSEPKNVTQNLRLLKTKMRLGSATSTESEPYVNIPVKNQGGRNNGNRHAVQEVF